MKRPRFSWDFLRSDLFRISIPAKARVAAYLALPLPPIGHYREVFSILGKENFKGKNLKNSVIDCANERSGQALSSRNDEAKKFFSNGLLDLACVSNWQACATTVVRDNKYETHLF